MKTKKYYIEFHNDNSETENYDMQSRFFDTRESAVEWLRSGFDFIDEEERVYVMTAEFNEDGDYDITESEEIKH